MSMPRCRPQYARSVEAVRDRTCQTRRPRPPASPPPRLDRPFCRRDGRPSDSIPPCEDFWATTSNKQLNFLQHVRSLLTINGRAAIVVPDNVLFEGGVGETIRRKLLERCDVHALLRLPYRHLLRRWRQGQRAVLRPQAAAREALDGAAMIYDFRTNQSFTLKTRALVRADLDDFVA